MGAMGWRFRRSLKIAPGLRLNIGKRSAGLSVGPRGAKVSINTRGEVRRTAGLPGTGLSYTEQTTLGGNEAAEHAPEFVELPGYAKRHSPRKIVGWTSVAVILLIAFLGAPTLAGYLVLPAVGLTIAAPWLARPLGAWTARDG
jgi:hypothetical protein